MTTGPDATGSSPAGWGIQDGYVDAHGEWQQTTEDVAAPIRRAMGAASEDPTEPQPRGTPLHIVRPGGPHPTLETGDVVVLEDGVELDAVDTGTGDELPLGYHQIVRADGTGEHLIAVPTSAPLDPRMRAWGLTAQLYAAGSTTSWGIGDLRDLATLTEWATGRGAQTIGLNPLHASAPGKPPENSPYSPSTRRWKDPIYLDVERLLKVYEVEDRDQVIAAGRALNDGDRIDRTATWTLKRAALESVWPHARGHHDLAQYRAHHGEGLTLWGTYCALADHLGGGWPTWPTEYRHPGGPAVTRFADEHSDQVDFWCWLQFLMDEQLRDSGAPGTLIADLAVGFAADGFDAWEWQDLLATGCRIGAPPDLLGPAGQDWGLPPLVPWQARGAGYRPFAETLRAALRHSKGIRIDHVMGLLRLYWIPPGLTATDGAFVEWHQTDLLDILALEAHRADAMVVGEDLGTVDPGIQDQLRSRGVLSTRLLWFEDDAPEDWPAQAMAAVTTHDLPTVAGVWTGVDLSDLHAAGAAKADEGNELFRHRLRVAGNCDDQAEVDDVVVAAHRSLARSPAMLITAALDDVTGARHRTNVPGTIDEHPNWRIPLPLPLEDLDRAPLADPITEALQRPALRTGHEH